MPQFDEMMSTIERMGPEQRVAWDTETTGVDLYAGDVIRGLSVSYRAPDSEIVSTYLPVSHPGTVNLTKAQLARLREVWERTRSTGVFWNWPFDAASLSQLGLRPKYGEVYDGSLIAHLINENDSHKLKVQGDYYLQEDASAEQRAMKALFAGVPAKEILANIRPFIRKGKVGVARQWAQERAAATKKTWATLTGDDIAAYAAKDTDITLRLAEMQEAGEIGDPEEWGPALDREHAVQGVVYRMVKRGVRVDTERAHDLALRYNARIADIEPEFEGTNLGSPKQLGELLFGKWGLPIQHRTDSGAPSTDKDSLVELIGQHPGIELILEHRSLTKMVGTYLNPMAQWADSNGRVHSSINTTGTVTGRFSSSHPNLQNIPKTSTDDTVKKLYLPSDGMELWEFDLHSAELYVGASLANDTDMMAALSEPGRDFHSETSRGVFGTDKEPFRSLAKNMNYTIPYGGGATPLAIYMARGLRVPMSAELLDRAARDRNKWMRTWPKTAAAMKRTQKYAEAHDVLPMVTPGRHRHFSGWRTSVPYFNAWNAAVQGGVAELMKLLMVEAEPALAELGAYLVLQVHDSIWAELVPGTADEVLTLLQSVLDGINLFRMRLTMDAKRLN